ncbi:hypothetical protein P3S68_022470 [Capsicum galapagoense]
MILALECRTIIRYSFIGVYTAMWLAFEYTSMHYLHPRTVKLHVSFTLLGEYNQVVREHENFAFIKLVAKCAVPYFIWD